MTRVPFDVHRLSGDFAFYDDGWQATLGLRVGDDGHIDAEFRAYDRTRGQFTTTAVFDESAGPRLLITVSDFNELPQQRYEGYLFRRGPVAFAGRTEWKGQPFAFFACRRPPYTLGPLRPERVHPADFLGTFGLYHDGDHATLILSGVRESVLSGILRADGEESPVTATVDPAWPYQLELAVGAQAYTLLMFRQRRTAMAGWFERAGERLGCYAIRHAGPTS
ncbi:MAG: hypothetical protein ABW022_09025 [Actinoplanes sp.]